MTTHAARHEMTVLYHYLIAGDLRELLDQPQTGEVRRSMLSILDVLLDDEAPWWPQVDAPAADLGPAEWRRRSRDVGFPRGENVCGFARLSELRVLIRDDLPLEGVAAETSRNLGDWMRVFADCASRGLLQEDPVAAEEFCDAGAPESRVRRRVRARC